MEEGQYPGSASFSRRILLLVLFLFSPFFFLFFERQRAYCNFMTYFYLRFGGMWVHGLMEMNEMGFSLRLAEAGEREFTHYGCMRNLNVRSLTKI